MIVCHACGQRACKSVVGCREGGSEVAGEAKHVSRPEDNPKFPWHPEQIITPRFCLPCLIQQLALTILLIQIGLLCNLPFANSALPLHTKGISATRKPRDHKWLDVSDMSLTFVSPSNSMHAPSVKKMFVCRQRPRRRTL